MLNSHIEDDLPAPESRLSPESDVVAIGDRLFRQALFSKFPWTCRIPQVVRFRHIRENGLPGENSRSGGMFFHPLPTGNRSRTENDGVFTKVGEEGLPRSFGNSRSWKILSRSQPGLREPGASVEFLAKKRLWNKQ